MQITDSAKMYIEGILKQQHASGIRVIYAGMGCGSPKIGLSLAEPGLEDIVEMVNGIRVAVENRVAPQAQHVTLDVRNTPSGSGLVMLGSGGCC